jgi:hypothetical protein
MHSVTNPRTLTHTHEAPTGPCAYISNPPSWAMIFQPTALRCAFPEHSFHFTPTFLFPFICQTCMPTDQSFDFCSLEQPVVNVLKRFGRKPFGLSDTPSRPSICLGVPVSTVLAWASQGLAAAGKLPGQFGFKVLQTMTEEQVRCAAAHAYMNVPLLRCCCVPLLLCPAAAVSLDLLGGCKFAFRFVFRFLRVL